MELLLILTYTAICYAIFRIFKVPVNKWTIPTAVLGGVVLIALILLVMNYNHPYTKEARLYFYTTPIVPVVRGEVIEVPVQANVPLKQGDVLFRIDPRPYEYAVQQKRAALAEAEQGVRELGAALEAARADADAARAARDRAQQAFARYEEGEQRGGRGAVFSELEVENRRGTYLGSEAALASALARAEQARIAHEAEIDGVNPTVARLQAELRQAEFDLAETTVRAPTDGYVTQLFLRPGMIAVPLPLRPVMVFIHSEDNEFAAAFQQNALQRVRAGDEAEIAFDGVPGRVFQGKVSGVMDAVAQGQLQPTGAILNPEAPDRLGQGRAIAYIDIVDDLSAYQLPAGSAAQVALYTEHWQERKKRRKPLRHHQAHPAAHEELAELRVPRRALTAKPSKGEPIMSSVRLLFCAALATAAPHAASAATFGELATWCAPQKEGGSQNLCTAYLDSYLQLLASPDEQLSGEHRACVPKSEPLEQIAQIARAYADRNPSSRELAAPVGLGMALQGRYPCS